MPTMTWTYVDSIDAAGKPIDFEAFDETQNNVNLINEAIGPAMGEDTFNGTAGRTVVFGSAQADSNYIPLVIPVANPAGNLGEVYFPSTAITTASFTVMNTGNFVGAFRWKILR